MAVPTKNQLHRVVLEIAAETAEPLSRRDVVELLRTRLSLTEDDMAEQSSSGVFRVADRTDWAMFDLRRAGYLYRPTRGRFLITPEGRAILQKHHLEITDADLRPLIREGHLDKGTAEEEASRQDEAEQTSDATPDEQMELAFNQSRDKLVDDLLSRISNESYRDFEVLVLDLLKKMGYGEPEHTGRSRDGGIDGIINQDALGLEKVYVQAKRWSNQVGEPEIRNFSGSLDPHGATKGVFITTSTFSSTARQTAQTISAGSKFIRLVDGHELAQLMIRHGVGVVTEYTYEIKKLDENYFVDEI